MRFHIWNRGDLLNESWGNMGKGKDLLKIVNLRERFQKQCSVPISSRVWLGTSMLKGVTVTSKGRPRSRSKLHTDRLNRKYNDVLRKEWIEIMYQIVTYIIVFQNCYLALCRDKLMSQQHPLTVRWQTQKEGDTVWRHWETLLIIHPYEYKRSEESGVPKNATP